MNNTSFIALFRANENGDGVWLLSGVPHNQTSLTAAVLSTLCVVDEYGYATNVRGVDEAQDGVQPTLESSRVPVVARLTGWNGGLFDRIRTTSASTLAASNGVGAIQVGNIGNWSVSHAPAAGGLATVTRAGEPGRRHVITSIAFSVSGPAANTHRDIELVDGINVVWRTGIATLAGDSKQIALSGLSIVISAGNAVTLRFSAAPDAVNFQRVSMTGYTAR